MTTSPSSRPQKAPSPAGFTLLELLVSVSVLVVIALVLVRMTDLSSRSLNEGQRRADNFTKARAALDLFAQDVGSGVFRDDLGAFRDQNGAFAPAFYTRRPGTGGDRSLSLIAYQTDHTKGTLLRGNLTVPWADTTGIGFGAPAAIPRVASIQEYQEIGSGVIRIEFYFLDDQGNYQAEYQANSKLMGVAIASVDESTLKLLRGLGNIADLRDGLSRQSPQTKSYQAHWDGLILRSNLLAAYPAPVGSGLRIFERVIPLP